MTTKKRLLWEPEKTKIQKLQMSQNEILLKTILPIIFSIPEKFEIYFLGLP